MCIASSSTIQLHDNLGSRHACACSEAGFSSQNGDRALGVYYRRAAFYCAFYGQKDSMQRISRNKCFLFMVGSVCCIKQFTIGSRNSLRDVWKLQLWNRGVDVAETTVERLLCCKFRCTPKEIQFNSIQFNLFHPRIIIHDMGHVKD
jgi:hypothetical protein